MKKILTVAALLFVVILSLTACDGFNGFGKDTECEVHTPDESVVKNFVVATCYSEGSFDNVVYCTVCDTELSRTTVTLDKASHNYVGRICTVCGDINYSEGLAFELNSDGASYTVTGLGSCRDTDIIIPSTYNGCPVTAIGDDAFSICTSLTSVTIGDSVTTIGDGAFYYCTSLTSIEVSKNNAVYSSINGNLYTKDGKTLIQYSIGKKDTSFTIPNSVTTIGGSAFENCDSLTSVPIPNSVTTIGDYAFRGCTNLTSVTIPDSVTTIGNYAFYDCDNLTSVTIPDSVTTIGDYAFYDCDSLTSVTIPDSVKTIGEAAFDCCSNLKSVKIGNSVTTIGDYAFSRCTSLTSVRIPDSVTTIGDHAFFYCTKLTNVTIGNNVTWIGHSAFEDCQSLTSVTIPDSVTTIGAYAFYDCDSLTRVTFEDATTLYRTSGGEIISVKNPSDNATYFKSTYEDYYWYKK